jgi:hypothetical protein
VTPGRVKSVPPADRCSILLIIRSIGTRLKNYLSARRRAKSGEVIADINHEEEFMGRLVILKSFHVWDRGRTKLYKRLTITKNRLRYLGKMCIFNSIQLAYNVIIIKKSC